MRDDGAVIGWMVQNVGRNEQVPTDCIGSSGAVVRGQARDSRIGTRLRRFALELLDHSRLRSSTLGTVDLWQVTARTEFARRPRAKWWERLLDGVEPVRTAVSLDDPTLHSWAQWARTAWIPRVLELVNAVGATPHEVFDWFAAKVEPRQRGDRLVAQFKEAFGDRTARLGAGGPA